jgi:hypothetical protein
MAVFGFGAYYDGTTDMTEDFLSNGVACVGWSRSDAPTLHRIIRHIKMGDLVYIKAHPPPQGLIIKGVGIVENDEIFRSPNLGEACLRVRWVWRGSELIGHLGDRYPVRNITLYEEFNPKIIGRVIELLTSAS